MQHFIFCVIEKFCSPRRVVAFCALVEELIGSAVKLVDALFRIGYGVGMHYVKQDGYALIPLSIYLSRAKVKLEIGLAKGKKLYDKRESAAKRDAKREIDRTMKSRNA